MNLCRKLRGGWRRLPVGRRAAEAGTSGKQRSLFAEMRPCVWTMWACQMWPLSEERGQAVFRKRSAYFAYAVASWTSTTYIAWRALAYWYSKLQAADHFSLKAYYAWFLVVGHFGVAIPLLFWTNVRGVAEAFNYAQRFQVNFSRVTGRRLSFGVASKARVVGVMSPVVGLAFVLWSHDGGFVPWSQFPIFEMNATYLAVVPETWVLVALALETAARRLRAELAQVLAEGAASGSGRGPVLADLRWLWMQLQHLMLLWGRAWSPCLAHFLLSAVTVLLLSVFGICIPLLRGQVIDDKLAGMVTALVHNTYNINRICSAGSRVRREVRDSFVKDITRAQLRAKATSDYIELVKFLKLVDLQDPFFNLGGFTSLDRALAIACTSIIVTYVVVLMQFAYAKGAS